MKKIKAPVVELVETTFKSIFVILVFSLFLSSCATNKNTVARREVQTAVSLRPVYITNTKKVNLLMPSYADGIYEGIQLLNGSFGDTSFNLLSYTQIDAKGISLSLMNDFGADMGNLFYDGEKLIFDCDSIIYYRDFFNQFFTIIDFADFFNRACLPAN